MHITTSLVIMDIERELLMNNRQKRRILSLAILILMLSVLSYGTYAFFTESEIATNVITTGNIDITLVEQAKDDNGILKPFENVVGIMPGESVSKIVSVNNSGNNVAWVRVSVEKLIEAAEDKDYVLSADMLSIDFNTDLWVLRDGFWYYLFPLKPGECTEPLFTTVEFSGSMDNDYQLSVATINILAQATQYANNGDNVFDALGWATKETP